MARVNEVVSSQFPPGIKVAFYSPEALLGKEEITQYARSNWEEVAEWICDRNFPAWKSRGRWRASRTAIDEWFRKQVEVA